MSEKVTRFEHPLPAVIMHYLHLLSFFALIITGIYIRSPFPGFSTMGTMKTIHTLSMEVFILTAVMRIYWAFFGRGSAYSGSLSRVRDYKQFAMGRLDWRTIGEWLKYYLFIRKTKPYTAKYNPLQKLTYGYVFPLGVLWMALTGFALYVPTSQAMSWFTNLMGGQNSVRLWHYYGMWVFLAVFLVHLYLVFAEDIVQFPLMFARHIPAKARVAGDYPSDRVPGEPTSPSGSESR